MNIRKFFVAVATAAAFLAAPAQLSIAAIAHAQSPSQEQAIDLVNQLGNKAVSLLSNADLDDNEKRAGFHKLVNSDFDMPLISKFVLGKYWRKATDAQKTEYQVLFQKFIVSTYQKRIGQYSGENIDIVKAKPLNKKETLVKSVITRPKGPPIKLDWRVRKSKSGDHKIVDIIVENVSMALTHREEFSSVISRNGGDVEGLIKKLRGHVSEFES